MRRTMMSFGQLAMRRSGVTASDSTRKRIAQSPVSWIAAVIGRAPSGPSGFSLAPARRPAPGRPERAPAGRGRPARPPSGQRIFRPGRSRARVKARLRVSCSGDTGLPAAAWNNDDLSLPVDRGTQALTTWCCARVPAIRGRRPHRRSNPRWSRRGSGRASAGVAGSTCLAPFHRSERWMARAHWKNTVSTVITMTERAGLPSMAKLAHSAASTTTCARAVDPQRRSGARDQEKQPDAAVADDVLQRIGAVVAAPVGHHQRPLVVHAHEAGEIAARRAVEPFRPAGGERHEGRCRDQRGIFGDEPVALLDQRGLAGLAVERFQFFDRR